MGARERWPEEERVPGEAGEERRDQERWPGKRRSREREGRERKSQERGDKEKVKRGKGKEFMVEMVDLFLLLLFCF